MQHLPGMFFAFIVIAAIVVGYLVGLGVIGPH